MAAWVDVQRLQRDILFHLVPSTQRMPPAFQVCTNDGIQTADFDAMMRRGESTTNDLRSTCPQSSFGRDF
jgi:hypothetical protein